MTYFNFNTSRPPLDDPRVRRAIAMLIDQETILERIYENADERAGSILLPSSWAFDPAVAQPGYDPGAADALLDEAGVRDIAFELGTHSEDVNRIQTVEFLQNQLASHGIRVEVGIRDWPTFSLRRDSSDYDVILLGWTQLVDPDKGAYDQFHSRGTLNWGHYRNARVDELLEQGRATVDREKRASIYREVASIVASEVPYYVLSYQGYHVFHTPRIAGFAPDPRGMLRSLASSSLVAPD
jgi:peptide/nickel transport system substrate-binding protein